MPSHPTKGRKGIVTFRGSTHIPRNLSLRHNTFASKGKFNALYLTVNGVKPHTLLALCKLARGIAFLRIGALSAAGAASLSTPGKEHVSRLRHSIALFLNSTIPDSAS